MSKLEFGCWTDFGWVDVIFWEYDRLILVLWTLDFGLVDVGFWLCVRMI